MLTASAFLDMLIPPWRASVGADTAYFDAFVRRKRATLEAMLEPIVAEVVGDDKEPENCHVCTHSTPPDDDCRNCGSVLVDAACPRCPATQTREVVGDSAAQTPAANDEPFEPSRWTRHIGGKDKPSLRLLLPEGEAKLTLSSDDRLYLEAPRFDAGRGTYMYVTASEPDKLFYPPGADRSTASGRLSTLKSLLAMSRLDDFKVTDAQRRRVNDLLRPQIMAAREQLPWLLKETARMAQQSRPAELEDERQHPDQVAHPSERGIKDLAAQIVESPQSVRPPVISDSPPSSVALINTPRIDIGSRSSRKATATVRDVYRAALPATFPWDVTQDDESMVLTLERQAWLAEVMAGRDFDSEARYADGTALRFLAASDDERAKYSRNHVFNYAAHRAPEIVLAASEAGFKVDPKVLRSAVRSLESSALRRGDKLVVALPVYVKTLQNLRAIVPPRKRPTAARKAADVSEHDVTSLDQKRMLSAELSRLRFEGHDEPAAEPRAIEAAEPRSYPPAIKSPARRALYDEIGDAALVVKLDAAIVAAIADGWTTNTFKTRRVRNAIAEALGTAGSDADRVLAVAMRQADYL